MQDLTKYLKFRMLKKMCNLLMFKVAKKFLQYLESLGGLKKFKSAASGVPAKVALSSLAP